MAITKTWDGHDYRTTDPGQTVRLDLDVMALTTPPPRRPTPALSVSNVPLLERRNTASAGDQCDRTTALTGVSRRHAARHGKLVTRCDDPARTSAISRCMDGHRALRRGRSELRHSRCADHRVDIDSNRELGNGVVRYRNLDALC